MVFLLFALLSVYYQTALAECLKDEDWPDKPCLDSGTYSKSERIQMWDKYYEFKGEDWMQMKKVEMDKAISDGTFGDWLNDPVNGSGNKNIYTYYRLHDAVPNMVFDPYSGNYIIQGSEPPRGEWYATTTGLTTITATGVIAAIASFFAYKKALRK